MNAPAKYRKKPVVIDAFQTNGTLETAMRIAVWSDEQRVETV